jgi:hypothetical protein
MVEAALLVQHGREAASVEQLLDLRRQCRIAGGRILHFIVCGGKPP